MTTGLAHLLGKHQLRPEDLDDVFSYVQAASPKWVSHLKMSSTETRAIVNTTGLSDQKNYFQEMLTKWLTLAPPQHPIPTTEALAEAIGKAWSENLAFKLKKEAMFVGRRESSPQRTSFCDLKILVRRFLFTPPSPLPIPSLYTTHLCSN